MNSRTTRIFANISTGLMVFALMISYLVETFQVSVRYSGHIIGLTHYIIFIELRLGIKRKELNCWLKYAFTSSIR